MVSAADLLFAARDEMTTVLLSDVRKSSLVINHSWANISFWTNNLNSEICLHSALIATFMSSLDNLKHLHVPRPVLCTLLANRVCICYDEQDSDGHGRPLLLAVVMLNMLTRKRSLLRYSTADRASGSNHFCSKEERECVFHALARTRGRHQDLRGSFARSLVVVATFFVGWLLIYRASVCALL
jgi:hypothetical protein